MNRVIFLTFIVLLTPINVNAEVTRGRNLVGQYSVDSTDTIERCVITKTRVLLVHSDGTLRKFNYVEPEQGVLDFYDQVGSSRISIGTGLYKAIPINPRFQIIWDLSIYLDSEEEQVYRISRSSL